MSDIIACLRSEIVESEKARIDLLKWKIILVAALGAVSFGMSKENAQPVPALLGFIPLVCAYVDVLCIHNNLRILVIAHFLRTDPTPAGSQSKAYEELCLQERPAFVLESGALVGTTIVFSGFVALVALYPDILPAMINETVGADHSAVRVFLGGTALLGVSISVGATVFQSFRDKKLQTGG